MLYKEWCSKFNTRCGNMVTLPHLEKIQTTLRDTGYSGIYAFNEEDAKAIINQRSSQGMDRFEVTSSQLPIDLDDGDDSVEDVLKKLEGYKYELWTSGGKGYHIILFHEPITSIDLPYSHRQWIEDIGISCDISLYQHGRIFSMPGRVHPKTKRRKALIRSVEGDLITVKLKQKPELELAFDGEEEELLTGLLNLVNLATYEPPTGRRHTKIWGTAKDLLRAGFPQDAVEKFILRINEEWKNKKPEEEVLAAINQASR